MVEKKVLKKEQEMVVMLVLSVSKLVYLPVV